MPRFKRKSTTDQYPQALDFLARFGGDVEKAGPAWVAAVREWAADKTQAEILGYHLRAGDIVASREDLGEPDLEQRAREQFRRFWMGR
ncbi:hypothetical protein J2S40_001145 [Nocardioides luteus]|uniref:Uncharacterized protein n=1 Tax=Nocardioides luteus TaxID=1844 RepID=A0ABQ5SU30_9ACTN|nr:hypothetical protein [Nocardioides luteus]MDR7310087.1 hypothetical protein [Nocardioides luteus]GGR64885.1 hypothetical protein GCM10010197_35430 [Nocardioides luteus]GLJ67004.1 hypothetical protein GCM10017579_10400 [Nocardioides luteus]